MLPYKKNWGILNFYREVTSDTVQFEPHCVKNHEMLIFILKEHEFRWPIFFVLKFSRKCNTVIFGTLLDAKKGQTSDTFLKTQKIYVFYKI